MKIKKGDTVLVIAGKDRGRSGTILRAFPKKEQVLVEGMGIVKKHKKSSRRGQAGQIISRPTPLHVSNVALKDGSTNKPSRVGSILEDGKKIRITKGSNTKV